MAVGLVSGIGDAFGLAVLPTLTAAMTARSNASDAGRPAVVVSVIDEAREFRDETNTARAVEKSVVWFEAPGPRRAKGT